MWDLISGTVNVDVVGAEKKRISRATLPVTRPTFPPPCTHMHTKALRFLLAKIASPHFPTRHPHFETLKISTEAIFPRILEGNPEGESRRPMTMEK